MSSEPESLVLRYLRTLDERTSRMADDLRDLKVRVPAVETQIGTINSRLDRIELRLDRIETRLGLVEPAP